MVEGSPQLEDGYTRISNELLEAIYSFGFSKRQFKIILCVIRQTYGWGESFDYLSNVQLADKTNLDRSDVRRALNELKTLNVIIEKGKSIGINKHYKEWGGGVKHPQKGVKHPRGKTPSKGGQNTLKGGQNTLKNEGKTPHTKEKKETNTKEKKERGREFLTAPPGVNQSLWDDFMQMRTDKKAINSDRAVRAIKNKIQKLQLAGYEADQLIERSIVNAWKDLYIDKNDKPKTISQDIFRGAI